MDTSSFKYYENTRYVDNLTKTHSIFLINDLHSHMPDDGTRFRCVLSEPLQISNTAEVFLDFFLTYDFETAQQGKGGPTNSCFLLDINELNIKTRSNIHLFKSKIVIPNEMTTDGFPKVHKGRKLNYVATLPSGRYTEFNGSITNHIGLPPTPVHHPPGGTPCKGSMITFTSYTSSLHNTAPPFLSTVASPDIYGKLGAEQWTGEDVSLSINYQGHESRTFHVKIFLVDATQQLDSGGSVYGQYYSTAEAVAGSPLDGVAKYNINSEPSGKYFIKGLYDQDGLFSTDGQGPDTAVLAVSISTGAGSVVKDQTQKIADGINSIGKNLNVKATVVDDLKICITGLNGGNIHSHKPPPTGTISTITNPYFIAELVFYEKR
jgi:hypothetical protein